MARVAWVLFDPIGNETLLLPINPDAGGSPARRRTVTSTATTAGKMLHFEGEAEPRIFEASGTILAQAHYEALDRWFRDKKHQVRVTDDLGRVFWVLLLTFTPTRVRKASRPWYHNYTLTYVELDVA